MNGIKVLGATLAAVAMLFAGCDTTSSNNSCSRDSDCPMGLVCDAPTQSCQPFTVELGVQDRDCEAEYVC